MNYCPKCHLLCEEANCPACGTHWVRQPREGDYCFLSIQSPPWAQMLLDVLKDNGIPTASAPAEEAFVSAVFGQASERLEIFVPYENLEEAQRYQEELLCSSAEIEIENENEV